MQTGEIIQRNSVVAIKLMRMLYVSLSFYLCIYVYIFVYRCIKQQQRTTPNRRKQPEDVCPWPHQSFIDRSIKY